MNQENDNENKLITNDIALVIRPIFNNLSKKWDGNVDLNAIIMPVSKNLEDEEHEIIKDSLYALVTCYHLLNTDIEFADRIREEMSKLTDEGGLDKFINKDVGDVKLSTWTKTEGDVH